MKKILILANSGMGLFKFRKELLLELLSNEYQVVVSFPKDEFTKQITDLGCSFIDTSIDRRGTNIFSDIFLILKYRKIIYQENPDLVLTYTIKPNIYGGLICKLSKKPYIVNITGLGTALESNDVLSKVLLRLYKFCLSSANVVFFQNMSNLTFFKEKKIVKNNYELLPGSGVNLTQFFYSMKKVEEEKLNILYIGRIMASKGIIELLEAAKELKKENIGVNIQIIGFYEEDFESIILDYHNLNYIEYLGIQNDVTQYILEADAIIQPSYHEGMSNVLLEGGAMGKPLLASNISGCKEIIDDGVNGYLFSPKNSRDIYDSIIKFLNIDSKTRLEMGKNSRSKIELEFDRRIIVSRYINKINNILKGEEYE